MATPAPCLLVLRAQLDARYPSRSKTSDGIMGDESHLKRKSDHNLGNAIDLTDSPAHGFDSGRFAERLRHQMSHNALGRVSLLIANGYVASPRTGWKWNRYTGLNPHAIHVHISIVASRRGDTRKWSIG